jgi:hypothetical protein
MGGTKREARKKQLFQASKRGRREKEGGLRKRRIAEASYSTINYLMKGVMVRGTPME